MAWLNPVPDDHWDYIISMHLNLFDNRMYPLTLKGLEEGWLNCKVIIGEII